jgi:type IV fimbrial biogenesis protein FimT
MLNLRHNQQGVTLVELMIGLVIVGFLFALGVPAYSGWIQNQKIRTAAESILNGIQLARNSAVSNNAPARFNLCDAASSWQVLAASSTAAAPSTADTLCGAGVTTANNGNEIRQQERSGQEGSRLAQVTATSVLAAPPITAPIVSDGSTSITFSSLGRVMANDPAVGGNSIAMIQVTIPTNPGDTPSPLLIIVQTGGTVRMCDPSTLLSTNDPRHC